MPRVTPDESLPGLLVRARGALHLSQEEFGRFVQSSRRTAGRWEGGQAEPAPQQILAIARAVHPEDRALAAQIAAQAGETLVSLELEAPPQPVVPPRPPAPIALLVESVVCAAAEALDAKPATARDSVRAAFQRARAMSLTVEEVDDALRPALPAGESSRKTPRKEG